MTGPFSYIFALLDHYKRSAGAREAILAPGSAPLTYEMLWLHVDKAAHQLRSLGVTKRDRVAVVMEQGLDSVVVTIAVAAGAVCVPLDPAFTGHELQRYLIEARATALLAREGVGSASRAVAHALGIPVIELMPLADRRPGAFDLVGRVKQSAGMVERRSSGDDAFILLTSGSTSRPKVVPLTQASVCLAAHNVAAVMQLAGNDRLLNVLPLFHVHGLIAGVLTSLTVGSSVVCTSGFEVDAFFAWLHDFQPTWYTAVPPIHRAVLSAARRLKACPTSLRAIRSASAPLPPDVLNGLEDVFGVPVIETYGTTEAGSQVAANPLEARKLGSVGLPVGVEIAIVDDKGRPLSTNQRGEVVLRGPTITRGYENDATATQQAFRDGWFRTGDLGYLDRDGYLFIVGRLKEVINRGGEEIAPSEVEEVLLKHPDVLDAAVFSVPHTTLGADVAAAVVVRPGGEIASHALRAFVRQRLARFKIPGRIHFVPEIPRSATGKIKRAELAGLGSKPVSPARTEQPGTITGTGSKLARRLAQLWAEVLNVDQIGVDQDVFAFGADSLAWTQMLSRVRAHFKIGLSFQDLLELPTAAALAARIGSSQRQRSERARLRNASTKGRSTHLSFQQQRIYLLSKLDRIGHNYHVIEVARLSGRLRPDMLEASISHIVERHAALRTTFREVRGEPVQTVGAPRLRFDRIELRSTSKAKRSAAVLRHARAALCEPFNIEREAPLRVQLIRFDEEDHALIIKLHHLITDGWSQRIFWQELETLYAAKLKRASGQLPELSIDYGDFCQWQRRWLRSRAAEGQLAYWRAQLEGLNDLQLPIDQPRPEKWTGRGARHPFKFSRRLSHRIKSVSQAHGVTIFMMLLAALQCLMQRYTGCEDIAIGTLIANRNRLETEPLIGMFANTIVLRTNLSGDPRFSEVLRRTRQVTLDAYRNQDLPIELVLKSLRVPRKMDRNSLFQVMFILQSAATEAPTLSELQIEFVDIDPGIARFDLMFEIMDTRDDGQLAGWIEYSTDLFERATVSRMATHLRVMLEAIVDDPEEQITRLPLLPSWERRRMLVAWNRTETGFNLKNSFCDHFFEQAERAPDAIAVSAEHDRVRYRELADRSCAVADRLAREGVGTEAVVVVLAERSADFLAAMIAVQRAGAAFLPLEPNTPPGRLAQIISHSRTPLVLAGQGCAEALDAALPRVAASARPLMLHLEAVINAEERDSRPGIRPDPANLAYVIYTSGSTGVPKGAMIEQRGLLNHLLFQITDLRLSASDVMAQTAPQSFDISIWQFLAPLMVGARVHVCSTQVMQDPVLLMKELRREGVTVLQIVPTLLREILDRVPPDLAFEALGRLRRLISTGEALPPDLCRDWFRRFSEIPLVNAYGPAECSDDVATYSFRTPPTSPVAVPIGRPIANTRLYVLDCQLQPVPIGVAGELYVGGIAVGRGYLNDREQTTRSFVRDPFANRRGARLYKTGDRGRWRADGTLEYLGRIDHQVKIRGHRIEPEEIEHALMMHPQVRSAVVLTRDDVGADNQLVAHIVATNSGTLDVVALRKLLQGTLPEYMLPAAFIFLDRMPVTPHGKIDRTALLSVREGIKTASRDFAAARNSTEKKLADIWADILKIKAVGIFDNFFDLGGHSLLAGRVLARIAGAFGISLPIRAIFEAPTIDALARYVETSLESGAKDLGFEITRKGRAGPTPVSIAQEHVLRIERELPGLPQFNLPIAYRLRGRLNIPALEQALVELVRRHESLRTRFAWEHGQPIGLVAPPHATIVRLIFTDLASRAQGRRGNGKRIVLRKVELQAEQEAWNPFDVGRLPLFRVRLWRLGANDHILVFVVHHVIVDGWSMGVFMQELSDIYAGLVCGRQSDLVKPALAFADFAEWQRQWCRSGSATEHFAYWKEQLCNAPTLFSVGGEVEARLLSSDSAHVPIDLSDDLLAGLRPLGRAQGATLFMTLLAGFKTLLLARCGKEDICVATAMANRAQESTEGVIGPMENTTIIRTRLHPDMPFREALDRVRDSVLEAHSRQELPFEILIRRLAEEGHMDPASVMQIFFVIQDVFRSPLNLPDVAIELFGKIHRTGQPVLPIDRTWLTVMLKQTASGLAGSCGYKSEFFDRKTIRRWMRDYKTVLAKVIENPNLRLDRLADSK